MNDTVDPRVDAYIDSLPDWQQAICREVRDLVHAADPEVVETIKFGNRPYFVLQGNICALLATKDHVNVFLYDGAIVPDPEHIITHGHDNKTARQIAIYQADAINAPAVTDVARGPETRRGDSESVVLPLRASDGLGRHGSALYSICSMVTFHAPTALTWT